MCRITPLVHIAVILAGCSREGSHPAAHKKPGSDEHAGHSGGHSMLMIQTEPSPVESGKSVKLKLMIHDAKGAMVKKFDVVHEEKVHLIIVRDGLDQFAHIHPAVDSEGNLTATYTFPTGGLYRLYADHQPTAGKQGTALGELKVAGGAPPAPTLTPNVPGKVKGDGLDAQVSTLRSKTGGETTIRFEIIDPAGTPVKDLQTYMGAMGHLVVLSQDGKQYVHAHPMDEKKADANVVSFMAHIPQPGLYKGWGQFKREGQVYVVPFVIQVEK